METGLILQHGHPDDCKGRKETELAVYGLLDFLQIDYDRVDHEPAYTMEACEAIDRVLEPAAICIGKIRVVLQPCCSSLSMCMVPPCTFVICRTRMSPSPCRRSSRSSMLSI